jgi:ubiquinone/menaquinone biosynthesis C-methylase UbiE
MKKIEPVSPAVEKDLTPRIRDFWTRRVNAERIMGRDITVHERGEEGYFRDLELQRYRSHRHLLPWITAMTPGKTVLEIGSGVGLDTYTMASHGLQVTAVDLTDVGVATARRRFLRHRLPAHFLATDACQLPFPQDSFDYVYSFGVLHHVADTQKSVHEVYRVLKPGGEARVMLYHRHSLNEMAHRILRVPFEEKDELCPVVRRFTVEEARHLFCDFANVEIQIEYLYGEGYGKLFKLTPRWIYDLLSARWGWHLMIASKK